jgi:hypothetical protein
MKLGRPIVLVSIVIAVIAVIGCGEPTTEDVPAATDTQGTKKNNGPLKKSKFVVIVPTEGGKCTVHPFERKMGETAAPVEWLTFINFTDGEVKIQFANVDAIGDTTAQSLPKDTPVTFKIKDMTSQNKYEYSVVDGCTYEPPPGGPRVVIP